MDFVAIDIETTGTLFHVDRIVELAAVRFSDKKVTDKFISLVDPEIPMPEEAYRVNKITDDMLKGQPKIQDILKEFAGFCGRDTLVAHNAIFDFQFLSSAIEKHQSAAPQGLVLDTYSLSKLVFPELSSYKLSYLAQHFSIVSEGFHRAEHDAWACGRLFYIIMIKLQSRFGLEDLCLGDLFHVRKIQDLYSKKELRFPAPKAQQISLFD